MVDIEKSTIFITGDVYYQLDGLEVCTEILAWRADYAYWGFKKDGR